jgi:hypothetical protein
MMALQSREPELRIDRPWLPFYPAEGSSSTRPGWIVRQAAIIAYALGFGRMGTVHIKTCAKPLSADADPVTPAAKKKGKGA